MSETHNPVRLLFGTLLVWAGVIWMAGSGLCSGTFLIQILTEDPHFREVLSILPMIVLFGGFSVGIGFVVYIIGRGLAK